MTLLEKLEHIAQAVAEMSLADTTSITVHRVNAATAAEASSLAGVEMNTQCWIGQHLDEITDVYTAKVAAITVSLFHSRPPSEVECERHERSECECTNQRRAGAA